MIFTSANTQQAASGGFFAEYGLLILLAVLLVFMFWSSRRRTKKMREEQEKKAQQMLPGVKVMLQGGLYGELTHYDASDLSQPARVEIAPGVEIEVHSQAIMRIVEDETAAEPTPVVPDDASSLHDDAVDAAPETPASADPATDADDKPQA